MPHQDKLREEFEQWAEFSSFKGPTPIFNWFMARAIPKEEVGEVIEGMKRLGGRGFMGEEKAGSYDVEDYGYNLALSDLATRLGVKK